MAEVAATMGEAAAAGTAKVEMAMKGPMIQTTTAAAVGGLLQAGCSKLYLVLLLSLQPGVCSLELLLLGVGMAGLQHGSRAL